MNKKHFPFGTNLKSKYSDLHFLFSVEGGVYYFVNRENKYLVLTDFGTLADLLEQNERDEIITEYEFGNKEECYFFIIEQINENKIEEPDLKLPEILLK